MPLTPQASAFLAAVAEQNTPGWSELTPQQGREMFSGLTGLFGQGPEVSHVSEDRLPSGVRLRYYCDCEPKKGNVANDCPAVMFFHGGGWVLGDIDTHDPLCRRLAATSGCCIVAVDYRRSPEHRFPVPLNDCYEATRHVYQHAGELGIDKQRIAVAGDSAGGNLAAAVAIRARDAGDLPIQLQVLMYPVIEPRFDTPSYQQFAEGHGLTRETMQWFWQQYLGDQQAQPLAAVSRAESLQDLPPAHVVTAEYDVLRDEGEQFASLLQNAGVPTSLRRYEGNLHGFIHFAGIFPDGIDAATDVAHVMKQKLS